MGTLLINRDGERKPLSSSVRSKQNEKKYDYYGATGVIDKVDSYIFSEKLLLVGEDGANLLSKIKPNAFFAEGKYWVNNHAHILDATDKSLLDYVIVVINSISLDNYITGSAQPKLSQERLNKILLPLPPLSEQRRIVEKIEGLLALVDDLETNKTDLQSYIKQAKSKVLEMAIRGELVPQDSNNEPASVLLERIKNEQKPSKSKSKTTEHNTHYEEELPFNIPENWALTRMENICQLLDGEKKQGVELPYLDVKFLRGKIEGEIKESGKYIPKNTHLILVDGENSGEIFKAQQDGYQGSTLKILNISEEICKKYIFYILKKEQKLFKESKTGSAIPHLNKKLFNDLLIFLPPLAEQHRIVEKIEHIFAVLEELEENIL